MPNSRLRVAKTTVLDGTGIRPNDESARHPGRDSEQCDVAGIVSVAPIQPSGRPPKTD